MSETDRCARCGGDCPFIPDCEICGGCEEVACPRHYPEPGSGAIYNEDEYDDEDTGYEYGETYEWSGS